MRLLQSFLEQYIKSKQNNIFYNRRNIYWNQGWDLRHP